ncbi:MAG TPA: acylphosphatase [Methanocorpusculum sp.]|nr:acylphosphatase [Methanocorpusculum sp.]HJJ95521.1 acylphosphatase [Methanocorpusculum sp.]
MTKTVEILFSGRVQKIGFRSCLRNIGINLGLTGEVENLNDGRVRALVTGEEALIDKFISLTYSCPNAIIKNIETIDYVKTEFPHFTVKRE